MKNLMDNLGYEDMLEARDIYRALFKAYKDALSLGLSEDDIYNLLNSEEAEAYR